jgi:hypothetical protein
MASRPQGGLPGSDQQQQQQQERRVLESLQERLAGRTVSDSLHSVRQPLVLGQYFKGHMRHDPQHAHMLPCIESMQAWRDAC